MSELIQWGAGSGTLERFNETRKLQASPKDTTVGTGIRNHQLVLVHPRYFLDQSSLFGLPGVHFVSRRYAKEVSLG